MAGQFLTDDFLLQTKTARTLYHEHAANMPIYDYHCHLPAHLIAADHRFENLTQAWLLGDHYKWRAMRTNGVPEKFVTGDAGDWEKFEKWAETLPACLGNPAVSLDAPGAPPALRHHRAGCSAPTPRWKSTRSAARCSARASSASAASCGR